MLINIKSKYNTNSKPRVPESWHDSDTSLV